MRTRAWFSSFFHSAVAGALPLIWMIGCGSSAVALHPPMLTPNATREATTPIEFAAIGAPTDPDAAIVVAGGVQPPGPAAALTDGIRREIEARAFHGGESGGYAVRCRLDRFALRRDSDKDDGYAVIYTDLGCEAKRKGDAATVWRGELRGRTAAVGSRQFFPDAGVMDQVLADRAMSDVTRELASDLGLRVLELEGRPSARLFADQDAQQLLGGADDTPAGAAALAEDADAAGKFVEAAHRNDLDANARAAAWNAIAMASGPERPWIGGIDTQLADNTFVRFFQYKALARHATPATMRELKTARGKEEHSLLLEFLHDLEPTGGLGITGRTPSTTSL